MLGVSGAQGDSQARAELAPDQLPACIAERASFMTRRRTGAAAAIVGGLVSPLGAILGGVLLGVAEAFAARYLSSGLKDAIAFGLLFLVLVVRPHGLLALREAVRV